MSREIKFRAWDHKGGDINNMMFMVKPMGLLFRDAPIWLGMLTSEAILMQFTGLLDKNGKEIYEGDRIHCWGGEQAYGMWEFNETITIREFISDTEVISHFEYLEIIGNIYENPELLEAKCQSTE